MSDDLTSMRIRLVLLAIEQRRIEGDIPETAPVSTRRMAAISEEIGHPVAEATFRRLVSRAIRRMQVDPRVRAALAARARTSPPKPNQ